MRKVAVFTGTRAEYGILHKLLKEIDNASELELQLIVGAMHMSAEFGSTVNQIIDDGFKPAAEVDMLLSSDSPVAVAKSVGLGTICFAEHLNRLQPDLLILLGDRFEALSIAQAAMFLGISVAHLHGGELTQGVKDDAIRHAITKLSLIHFTACEEYRQRVIQLGEQPERVLNVGALGVENIIDAEIMTKGELSHSLNFDVTSPFILLTYHPVNLANEPAVDTFGAIIEALQAMPEYKLIITYPNADDGGRAIIPLIEMAAADHPSRILAIKSLGQARYFSAVKYASVVIGNSSSALIEVPALETPSVNIGQRQSGRLSGSSVIDCSADVESIKKAINEALSFEHTYGDNPYGSGNTSEKILEVIKAIELNNQKVFFDLPPTKFSDS